jgi:translation initiation factor IF-2
MKKDQKKTSLVLKPPLVVVLGHVDHGKTTLLDTIRKTKVATREAGGITQSVGASQIISKEGKKITFIDTPGHAAFKKMRSRGAQIADIAILVVAGDSGIKPQTEEAIKYIKKVKIPFIVVINKIDLSSSNPKTVKRQLEKKGLLFEGSGGDVPLVEVSAKKGKGVKELLEIINLMSEVNEIKGDPDGDLEAVVIETSKDNRGPLVSTVVRNGNLKVGDEVAVEEIVAKVRGLFNDQQKSVKEIKLGDPAIVLGFSKLPPVGAVIRSSKGKLKVTKEKKKKVPKVQVEEGRIPLVIKTKSAGSLQDLLANIPQEIAVIYSGVGDINESDVFMAKSASPARIFVFESKVPPQVLRLAVTEGVSIERFDVIYELFDRLAIIIDKKKEKILGEAQIVDEFPFNSKRVAGCKVLKGRIDQSDHLILKRDDEELGRIKAVSMKKQKQDVSIVKEGEEFGIIFTPQLDFKAGDMLVSVRR